MSRVIAPINIKDVQEEVIVFLLTLKCIIEPRICIRRKPALSSPISPQTFPWFLLLLLWKFCLWKTQRLLLLSSVFVCLLSDFLSPGWSVCCHEGWTHDPYPPCKGHCFEPVSVRAGLWMYCRCRIDFGTLKTSLNPCWILNLIFPWTQGPVCSADVNECMIYAGTPLSCQNGGTCLNTAGSYR